MKPLWLILAVPLLWALPAQATVFWDDEMESGNSGFNISALAGIMSYDTTIKFSGSGSVKLTYPSNCYPDGPNQCGGSAFRVIGTPTSILWRRSYLYVPSSFTVGNDETKLLLAQPTTSAWNIWLELRPPATIMYAYSGTNPLSANYFSSANMPRNVWTCIEEFIDPGTAGQANGTLQIYVNGTIALNRTNVPMRPAGDTSTWSVMQIFRQVGIGNIYWDRIAVGNSRIGCVGAPPPPDTTPPPVPTGFTVTP
jgi:hypothetical protein